ncbi:MAG: hypothetical protein IJ394_00335 [Bacteroidales bacterium]|nr:hypothetical protein [Bacteroidales bacterium]
MKDGSELILNTKLKRDPQLFDMPLTLVVNKKRIKAKQNGKRLEVIQKDGKSLIEFNPYIGGVILY